MEQIAEIARFSKIQKFDHSIYTNKITFKIKNKIFYLCNLQRFFIKFKHFCMKLL